MLERMKRLIGEHDICVLATVGPDGRPHCSLMSYLAAADSRRLYLLTGKATRKHRNMLANPRVSLLIDTRASAGAEGLLGVYSLVMDGIFTPLAEGPDKDELRRRLLARHPHLAELAAHPDAELVAVSIQGMQLQEGPVKAHYASLD
jgi:nitroimidazol reductase NimA-like FMN-containing flavoprotein (pyridoxamine 5'-phosphate oxidase superfamily)